MSWVERLNDKYRVRVREMIYNPIWGGVNRRKLRNPQFTIISNNCWAGHVYRYFKLPYDSPTIGLYFFADEYIRFLTNLKDYLSMDLGFSSPKESRYYPILQQRRQCSVPIGLLGDVELVFLHYKSEAEAYEKWNRRRSRIHWDHLIVKMSEQNNCSEEALRQFDKLPFSTKLVFTTNDYGLKSQIIFEDYRDKGEVANDTLHFRKFVHLDKLINCEGDFRRKNYPYG